VRRIERALRDVFGDIDSNVVSDHPSAAERARHIMADSEPPATLFVGGGGGTLRGVIEGIAASSNGETFPDGERVRIALLRMGSGNLLARELGVPRDPVAACERLVSSLREGRFSTRVIGRYELQREHGVVETRYAVGLAGFGALGRVPGDLERWNAFFPRLRRALRRLAGVERWNDVEYAAATFLRTLATALDPGAAETVEVRSASGVRKEKLLAGVVTSFAIAALPFDSGTSGPGTLTIHLLPYRGRLQAASLVPRARHHARSAIRVDVTPGAPVEVRLVDRDRVQMFLDEDPIELYRGVTISVAGSLTFVSGNES
jgi:diacylglycerol kinase family enzyme